MIVKCSVFIAASVDGFIAGPQGELDWLVRPEFAPEEIKGLSYADFIVTVDALVMGRNSFEKVLTFESWPYENTPVIVLTHRMLELPEALQGKVKGLSGSPEEIIVQLGAEGRRHLYIDGGKTIQQFLGAGLIDELTITRIPILLGAGIPLFDGSYPLQSLRLISSVASENGVVQDRYQVVHNIS
jgi:dihydrofolate reductase